MQHNNLATSTKKTTVLLTDTPSRQDPRSITSLAPSPSPPPPGHDHHHHHHHRMTGSRQSEQPDHVPPSHHLSRHRAVQHAVAELRFDPNSKLINASRYTPLCYRRELAWCSFPGRITYYALSSSCHDCTGGGCGGAPVRCVRLQHEVRAPDRSLSLASSRSRPPVIAGARAAADDDEHIDRAFGSGGRRHRRIQAREKLSLCSLARFGGQAGSRQQARSARRAL